MSDLYVIVAVRHMIPLLYIYIYMSIYTNAMKFYNFHRSNRVPTIIWNMTIIHPLSQRRHHICWTTRISENVIVHQYYNISVFFRLRKQDPKMDFALSVSAFGYSKVIISWAPAAEFTACLVGNLPLRFLWWQSFPYLMGPPHEFLLVELLKIKTSK